MTDHNRTEKIDVDFIYFCGHPSRARNRYDSLATPLGFRESDQLFVIYLSFMLLRMLNLSVFYFCDVFVASFIYVLIIMVLFIILLVNKSRSSLRTHLRAHSFPTRRSSDLVPNGLVRHPDPHPLQASNGKGRFEIGRAHV